MQLDSHAHLLRHYYKEKFSEIVRSTNIPVLIVGYDFESSQEAVKNAELKSFFYASCGFHPYDVKKLDEETRKQLLSLLSSSKVVAVGEIGLDYYRELTDFGLQRKMFLDQLITAKTLGLPVVIHSRQAFEDTLAVIQDAGYYHGVFHSFDYGTNELKKVLDAGFFVSFSGMATFSDRQDLREAMRYTPLDRILFETDCPYLAPEPLRGRLNLPSYVSHVYKLCSELHGKGISKIEESVARNFERVFNVKIFEQEDANV